MYTKLLMNNTIFLPAIALMAVIISFSGVRAIASSSNEPAERCKAAACITLNNSLMSPDELAVKAGSYVMFNNEDGKMHNISVGDGADDHHGHASNEPHDHTDAYSSGDFGKGEAWRVQFKQKGTYKLHDHYNPTQRILVVVY